MHLAIADADKGGSIAARAQQRVQLDAKQNARPESRRRCFPQPRIGSRPPQDVTEKNNNFEPVFASTLELTLAGHGAVGSVKSQDVRIVAGLVDENEDTLLREVTETTESSV